MNATVVRSGLIAAAFAASAAMCPPAIAGPGFRPESPAAFTTKTPLSSQRTAQSPDASVRESLPTDESTQPLLRAHRTIIFTLRRGGLLLS